ncbi:hypothetical protein [Fusibacter ferrireducens]|uniref:Uncharacterized protein n=1 Tax=Fusibacter ferrireducens TaxID=2785058 RepID=A0ABR9ZNB5_9FIRM|nr:hypothetical protein [Fusibacter ferrireducens]MBF4691962.1 hypothetical protein [Fusibacter ferrireducens]
MNSNEVDIETKEFNLDNQSFRDYLKGAIRVWLIVGILIAIFVLLRGILNSHISIQVNNYELENIQAFLFICVGIPFGMAFNGLIWGLISYLPYLLVRKVTAFFF